MTTTDKSRLNTQEWVIIGLILAIMASILFLTSFKNNKTESESDLTSIAEINEIEVRITGAVERPGFYTFSKGAKVGDLLDEAQPLPEANLRRIKRDRELRNGERIKIPEKETITVFIEGATKTKGPLKIAKGTKLEELVAFIELEPDADVEMLQKKRKLKDKEVISIPTIQAQNEAKANKATKNKKNKKISL